VLHLTVSTRCRLSVDFSCLFVDKPFLFPTHKCSSRCCSQRCSVKRVAIAVSPVGYAYSRDCLLSAYSPASPTFSVRQRIRELGLWTVSLIPVVVVSPTPAATALVELATVVLFQRSRLLVTESILFTCLRRPRRSISCSQPRTSTYLRDCSSSDARDSSSSDNHLVIASQRSFTWQHSR